MPSKIQLDENLWFLYICLQKSDLKSVCILYKLFTSPRLICPRIDFAAVGASTNLKPPAARMRYTRLRRQIESGTLIGTHGTPFPSAKVVEKNAEAGRKRKRMSPGENSENDAEGEAVENEDNKKRSKRQSMIKKEVGSLEEFDSSGESDGEFTDSEEEMPLAKVMKSRAKDPGNMRN